MYKYEITLMDRTLIVATSDSPAIYTVAIELTKNDSLFLHIGDAIVRKERILSIREVKVGE